MNRDDRILARVHRFTNPGHGDWTVGAVLHPLHPVYGIYISRANLWSDAATGAPWINLTCAVCAQCGAYKLCALRRPLSSQSFSIPEVGVYDCWRIFEEFSSSVAATKFRFKSFSPSSGTTCYNVVHLTIRINPVKDVHTICIDREHTQRTHREYY